MARDSLGGLDVWLGRDVGFTAQDKGGGCRSRIDGGGESVARDWCAALVGVANIVLGRR